MFFCFCKKILYYIIYLDFILNSSQIIKCHYLYFTLYMSKNRTNIQYIAQKYYNIQTIQLLYNLHYYIQLISFTNSGLYSLIIS